METTQSGPFRPNGTLGASVDESLRLLVRLLARQAAKENLANCADLSAVSDSPNSEPGEPSWLDKP